MTGSTPRSALLHLLGVTIELAKCWSEDGPPPDLEELFHAHRAFWDAQAQQRPITALREGLGAMGPARFEAALWIIDPGIYEPTLLAQALIRACAEVANEGGDPALDAATRLIALQIARVVNAPPSLRKADCLVFECTQRALGR